MKIRGKTKLANLWEDPVYVITEQPNDEIQVFEVHREDGKRGKCTLHRNLLLPVHFLPLSSKVKNRTTEKTTPAPRTSVPQVARSSSDEESTLGVSQGLSNNTCSGHD